MASFIPFNNKNSEICFFVFRPKVVLVDDLVQELKQFSLCAEHLGCTQSAILKSIHGNMIIWYGTWLKKSCEDKDSLIAILLPLLTNIWSMATLIEQSFFDAYAGETKNGSSVARLSLGDTISLSVAVSTPNDQNDLSYACLALFKSIFTKMDGATSGVCLKCQNIPRVVCIYVWKSLRHCYSWILNSDYRRTILPYLDHYILDTKYDIFSVVHVRENKVLAYPCHPHQMLGAEDQGREGQVMQE